MCGAFALFRRSICRAASPTSSRLSLLVSPKHQRFFFFLALLFALLTTERKQLFDTARNDDAKPHGHDERREGVVRQDVAHLVGRGFYRVYLQKYATNEDNKGFQRYWQNQVLPLFQSHGVQNEAHIRYYYEYVKTGIVSVLRLWLENGCRETPAELARILCRLLPGK